MVSRQATSQYWARPLGPFWRLWLISPVSVDAWMSALSECPCFMFTASLLHHESPPPGNKPSLQTPHTASPTLGCIGVDACSSHPDHLLFNVRGGSSQQIYIQSKDCWKLCFLLEMATGQYYWHLEDKHPLCKLGEEKKLKKKPYFHWQSVKDAHVFKCIMHKYTHYLHLELQGWYWMLLTFHLTEACVTLRCIHHKGLSRQLANSSCGADPEPKVCDYH